MRDIKDILVEWASCYIDRANNGYPKKSAFATERVQENNRSTDTYNSYNDFPKIILKINQEIESLSPPHRLIIKEQYTKRGTIREHAKNLRIAFQTYAQILKFIHDHLSHKIHTENN